jgi:trehalose 6-phosphate phosphatase
MHHIPLSIQQHALFLDFDGTLADIAPHPQAVHLHDDMLHLLQRAQQLFGGAVAIVSGRRIAEIDAYLSPLLLPVAGEHGAQRRNSDGEYAELDAQRMASMLAPLLQAATQLAQQHPELLLERKNAGFALHYRMAPALYTVCWQTLGALVQHSPALALMRGKYVLEVVPTAVDKGTAIHSFLQEPPFLGRIPIFVGDDVTDEAGFAAAQGVGGYGVKVGAGPSVARHRCPNPAALRAWLHDSLITAAATHLPPSIHLPRMPTQARAA